MINKKKKYDLIFPFGEACFTAAVMSRIHIRTQSNPFDWVYGANFEERLDIILNKFENFFNKEDLEFYQIAGKCDAYHNKRTDLYFNHDFPHGVNFEEYYPTVAQKYERRIKRALDIFNEGKKILLLYIDTPETKRGLINFEKLKDLIPKLHNVYPNAHFDLLYIKHNPDLKRKEIIYEKINENITIAWCNNKSTDPNAETWHANFENTIQALKIVSLKNFFLNYIKWKFKKSH